MALVDKSRLDMAADAAQARASIRYDMMKAFGDLDKRITLLEKAR